MKVMAVNDSPRKKWNTATLLAKGLKGAACQVACKSWHNLPGERTTFSETMSNPRYLNSNNYTRIIFREVGEPEGKLNWYFVKRQCMHCLDPACESVCPVGALIKLKDGPVVYDDYRCIGCRCCMMACPFQVPKFEWGSAVPLIRKCDFCADRIEIGLINDFRLPGTNFSRPSLRLLCQPQVGGPLVPPAASLGGTAHRPHHPG